MTFSRESSRPPKACRTYPAEPQKHSECQIPTRVAGRGRVRKKWILQNGTLPSQPPPEPGRPRPCPTASGRVRRGDPVRGSPCSTSAPAQPSVPSARNDRGVGRKPEGAPPGLSQRALGAPPLGSWPRPVLFNIFLHRWFWFPWWFDTATSTRRIGGAVVFLRPRSQPEAI